MKHKIKFFQKSKSMLFFWLPIIAVLGIGTIFSGYTNPKSSKNSVSLATDCCDSNLTDKNNDNLNFYVFKEKGIIFYNVPLVCGVTNIGCGARTKPILLSFDKSLKTKEIWYTLDGTIFGIVWKDGLSESIKNETANTIFTSHNQTVSKVLSESEYNTIYKSFKTGIDWFEGTNVDELNKAEASVYQTNLVKKIKEKTKLNTSNEAQMKQLIFDTFYGYNDKSLDELTDMKDWKKLIVNIISDGEKIIGQGNMPSFDVLWSSMK